MSSLFFSFLRLQLFNFISVLIFCLFALCQCPNCVNLPDMGLIKEFTPLRQLGKKLKLAKC